jgi:Holliday junction resolvasome RuvABC endonuclease subunit
MKDESLENKITIVGVDLSLVNTGLAIYRDGEIVMRNIKVTDKVKRENKIETNYDTYHHIISCIDEIIREESKMIFVIEDTFVNARNGATSKKLIQLGAYLRFYLTQRGTPFMDLPPTSLKLFVTGDGKATKEMMMKKIQEITKLGKMDDNVADAIGLCFFGVKWVKDNINE